jgi:hypothetical protein
MYYEGVLHPLRHLKCQNRSDVIRDVTWSRLVSLVVMVSISIFTLAMYYGLAGITDVFLFSSLLLFRNWKVAYQVLQSFDLHPDFRILSAVLAVPAIGSGRRRRLCIALKEM